MKILPPHSPQETIFFLRKFSGLNQIEMAKKLNITQGWLSKIESGLGDAGIEQLILIRKNFGISADDFLDGKVNYLEIQKNFDHTIRMHSMFQSHRKTQAQIMYGLIDLMISKKGKPWVQNQFKKIRFPLFTFSNPNFLINPTLIESLLDLADQAGITQPKRVSALVDFLFKFTFHFSSETESNQLSTFFDHSSHAIHKLDSLDGFSKSNLEKSNSKDEFSLSIRTPPSVLSEPVLTLFWKLRLSALKKIASKTLKKSTSLQIDELSSDSATSEKKAVLKLT